MSNPTVEETLTRMMREVVVMGRAEMPLDEAKDLVLKSLIETNIQLNQQLDGQKKHAEKLGETIRELRRQVTVKDQALFERNKQLDAMGWVWCSGGCAKGVYRYEGRKPEELTEEVMGIIRKNMARLEAWYANHEYRQGLIKGCSVYISGPYSKGDTEQNVKNAILAGDRVAELGFRPFIPHLYHFWNMLRPHDYRFWMDQDLGWVRDCRALIRLNGESPGGDEEKELARKIGRFVFDGMEAFEEYVKKQAEEKVA